jgi:hypothetical protein
MRFLILEQDLQGPVRHRRKAMAGLLEFLGVDPEFKLDFAIPDTRLPPPDVHFVGRGDSIQVPGRRVKAVAGSIVMNAHVSGAHRYIRRPSPVARRHFQRLQKSMTRTLSPDTASMLYEKYYRDEIDRLEALLGADLSLWRPT